GPLKTIRATRASTNPSTRTCAVLGTLPRSFKFLEGLCGPLPPMDRSLLCHQLQQWSDPTRLLGAHSFVLLRPKGQQPCTAGRILALHHNLHVTDRLSLGMAEAVVR